MLSEKANQDLSDMVSRPGTEQTRMGKMMSLGWLGQTVASLCWIPACSHMGSAPQGIGCNCAPPPLGWCQT